MEGFRIKNIINLNYYYLIIAVKVLSYLSLNYVNPTNPSDIKYSQSLSVLSIPNPLLLLILPYSVHLPPIQLDPFTPSPTHTHMAEGPDGLADGCNASGQL